MTETVVQPLSTARTICSPATIPAAALRRAELAVLLAATLLFGYLHGFFCLHVGTLWRDEVACLNVATLPTWTDLWNHMGFELMPIVFLSLLRGWAGVFGADNDVVLRGLGLLIGLGIVGALWLNARQFGGRGPLLSLVLLGGNPLFIRYADSLRGYGLGILTMLLTLAAVWRVLMRPSAGRVAVAMGAALVSVQTLYSNPVLLLAMCGGAAVAAGAERRWRTAALLLAIGLPAAASTAIWTHAIQVTHSWNFIFHYKMTPARLWEKFSEALGSPDPLDAWLWVVLLVGALALALCRLYRRPVLALEPDGGTADPAVRPVRFAVVALLLTIVGQAVFVSTVDYSTLPWHYIACMAMAAIYLDVLFSRAWREEDASLYARWVWLAALAGVAGFSFLPARQYLYARQTNMELQAQQLNKNATADDLIVCERWETAITLARYYHGKAAITTVPPMEEHLCHRYDLLLAQMETPEASAPVLARIEATLRAGHRIWLSGPLVAPAGDQEPTAPPPAIIVNRKFVRNAAYFTAWTEQIGYLLREHAESMTLVPVTGDRPIVEYESFQLTEFDGWH